jgi:hypothetical protein
MSKVIDVAELDGKLKAIEAEFQKAVQAAVQARDEQVRLRGEFDAITKLRTELGKGDEVKDG